MKHKYTFRNGKTKVEESITVSGSTMDERDKKAFGTFWDSKPDADDWILVDVEECK